MDVNVFINVNLICTEYKLYYVNTNFYSNCDYLFNSPKYFLNMCIYVCVYLYMHKHYKQ